jgi:S1-C subfamily serine protease
VSLGRSARALGLVAVAVLGGALSLVGAAALGRLGASTTVQQVVTETTATVPASFRGTGLSAEDIYRQDGPGVVQITATSVAASDPFSTPQQTQSLGSGFVLDKAGHIITNYHVIENAERVQVSFSGQDEIAAQVVGEDRSTDLAVLKVDAHARALNPLPLGASASVSVGDSVFAIGNPFGLTRTLTTGVVSAVQRQIIAPNSVPIENIIQTDAAINHGNSGGPLIDRYGKVIGVTSQIETGSGSQGNVGIGFAIPVDTVRSVAAQIISSGRAQHAFLGVTSLPLTSSLVRLFHLPAHAGLLIQRVQAGSAAAKAGMKAGPTRVVVEGESYQIGGDILIKVDGQVVNTPSQLYTIVNRHKPGDRIKIELYHGSKRKTLTVKLGARPGTS